VSRATTGLVGLVMVLVVGLTACGDGDAAQPPRSTIDPAEITTTEPESGGALPPAGALELEPIFGAPLAELGLELTDRGGLIDRSGGGYEPSAAGTHLALYVEPIGSRTVTQYIDGIRGVAVVFADVFERWPGLESYDVCQEPAGEDDPSGAEPLPVTQIELTKAEAAAIDWETVSVIDLVRASLATPPGLTLRVSSSLAGDPEYQAIVQEAS
jgi:hypothetical protein